MVCALPGRTQLVAARAGLTIGYRQIGTCEHARLALRACSRQLLTGTLTGARNLLECIFIAGLTGFHAGTWWSIKEQQNHASIMSIENPGILSDLFLMIRNRNGNERNR